MSKTNFKPVTTKLGAAFLAAAIGPAASAAVQPFSATPLAGGYDLVNQAHHAGEGKCGEGKCGEGKCGDAKDAEGKCGEGKCGGDKGAEGKCGEGKCGS